MGDYHFFRMTSDKWSPAAHPRWQLAIEPELPNGEWWDVWAYSRCEPAPPPPYPFTIFAPGPRCELNITNFLTYVASERVATVIDGAAHDEIQLIPTAIEGDPDKWWILNVLSLVDCLDYEQSRIDYYPDDYRDKNRRGKPSGIRNLVIDPQRIGDHRIFLIKDWTVAVIVSEHLKKRLEDSGAVGLLFHPVTP